MLITIGLVALAVLLFLLLWQGLIVLLVAFAAVLLAVFLNGIARVLERYTPLSYGWALGLVVLIIPVLLAGFIWLAGSNIDKQFSNLVKELPKSVEKLQEQIEKTTLGQTLLDNAPDPEEMVQAQSGGVGRIAGFFSTTLGALGNLVVIVIVGIYLAINPSIYIQGFAQLIPQKKRDRAVEVLHAMGHALRRWLVGRVVSMAIVGVLTTVGLLLLGVPLALSLGLLAALLSFIPNLGPILAVVPAMLIAWMDSAQLALFVAILYIAIQVVESYLITPMIEKKAVSIPPALLLMGQILFGVLFGIMGLVLATPLLVVVIVLVQMVYVEDTLGEPVEVLGEG
ncbi:MAG: AI-2E family transporter [Phycisphaerales bacterium]